MNCSKHKKYGAKRRPKVPCRECWLAWLRTENSSPEDLDVFVEQDRWSYNPFRDYNVTAIK